MFQYNSKEFPHTNFTSKDLNSQCCMAKFKCNMVDEKSNHFNKIDSEKWRK